MVRDRFTQFTQPAEVGEMAPAVVIAAAAITLTLVGGLVLGIVLTLLPIF